MLNMWRSPKPPTPPTPPTLTGEPDAKRKLFSDSPIKESKPKNSVKLRDFSIRLKRIDSSNIRDATPYTGGKGIPISVGRIDPSFDWKKEMKLKAENQKPNDLWADLSNHRIIRKETNSWGKNWIEILMPDPTLGVERRVKRRKPVKLPSLAFTEEVEHKKFEEKNMTQNCGRISQ